MSEKKSEISERKVTVTADDARKVMREAIADCAFPVSAGEPLKIWLNRVARGVGLTFNRLYDIYVGETIPRWHEGATILSRAEEKRRLKARWNDMAATNELARLETEQNRLEQHGDTALVGTKTSRQIASEDTPLPGFG